MPRRVRLPGADELFRPTVPSAGTDEPAEQPGTPERSGRPEPAAEPRRGSGRVRHDEKVTVYMATDELMALERARIELRATIGGAIDRGRLVREALALALADLDEHGSESALARRLSER